MKISNKKLYEKVAEIITLDITEGRLRPGDRLPSIRVLSEEYGVGQATIREALNTLRGMGYIEIKHGHGTFITEQTNTTFNLGSINADVEDVHNLLEVRNIVEVGIVKLASKNRTAKDLKELEAALSDMKVAINKNEYGEASDLRFHLAIADASKNKMLKQLLLNVSDIMQHTMKETRRIYLFTKSKSIEKLYYEHVEIYEAIKNQNEKIAYEKMTAHLNDVQETVLKNIDLK